MLGVGLGVVAEASKGGSGFAGRLPDDDDELR